MVWNVSHPHSPFWVLYPHKNFPYQYFTYEISLRFLAFTLVIALTSIHYFIFSHYSLNSLCVSPEFSTSLSYFSIVIFNKFRIELESKCSICNRYLNCWLTERKLLKLDIAKTLFTLLSARAVQSSLTMSKYNG